MSVTDSTLQAHKENLQAEFCAELNAIAQWWLTYSIDQAQGGFYGEVGADNLPVAQADKGVVLNARILWFFSELAALDAQPRYLAAAHRAFDYLCAHFVDPVHGGVYWAVDCTGQVIDDKKQVYAQAFAIYALVAYYQLTGNARARTHALQCFDLLEQHARDRNQGGYLEAFNREWRPLDDVRLSEKDLNYPKTMNTHLHVLEAYTTLHQAAPSTATEAALRHGIECFERHLLDMEKFHLRTFMDENWRDFSADFTYGHDIECSWLLAKAADSLGDSEVTRHLRGVSLGLANVCLHEALDTRGAMMDAYQFATRSNRQERVWWVQAEALVGFLNAFSLSGEQRYLAAAEAVWAFIKTCQIDREGGEWFWFSTLDQEPKPAPYKMGFWKGPYHNGRALMEAHKLLGSAGCVTTITCLAASAGVSE